MGQNPSEEIIASYEALRARLDRIEEDKGKLAMIYSGARRGGLNKEKSLLSIFSD